MKTMKCKKILALSLAVICLASAATLSVSAEVANFTKPAIPANTAAGLLRPIDTFDALATAASGKLRNDGGYIYHPDVRTSAAYFAETDLRYYLDGTVNPSIINVGGEHGNVLRISNAKANPSFAKFSFVSDFTNTGTRLDTEIKNGDTITGYTGVADGYVVAGVDFMFPNVAPAGSEPWAGGEMVLALGTHKTSGYGYQGLANTAISMIIRDNGNNKIVSFMSSNGSDLINLPYAFLPDEWYSLKIVADVEKSIFDLFINDVAVATDMEFYRVGAAINTIGVGSRGGAKTVPAGYTYFLGEASNTKVGGVTTYNQGKAVVAESETAVAYNPYPVCVDNIYSYKIDDAGAVAELGYGMQKLLSIPVRHILNMPKCGNAQNATIREVFTVDYNYDAGETSPLRNKITLGNVSKNGIPQLKVVSRSKIEDITGNLLISITKGDVDKQDMEFPITLKRELPKALNNNSVEVELATFTGSPLAGGTVTANALIYNDSNTKYDGINYIVAVYQGNRMVDVKLTGIDVAAGMSGLISVSVTPPESLSSAKVKAFMWDTDIKPAMANFAEMSFSN